MIDGYMSIKEASEVWNVSSRRIQVYCAEGRIEGAAKLGREWAIPLDTEKPTDKRVSSGRYKDWRKSTKNNQEELI